MEERTKYSSIAVSLTLLDAVAALKYGGVIWRTWSEILWSRLLLFLLAAVWATSLANLWARAFYEIRHGYVARDRRTEPKRASIARQLRGEGDV